MYADQRVGLTGEIRDIGTQLFSAQRAIQTNGERAGVRDPNHVKPGLGEATRVLLRRVPDRLIVRDPDSPDVEHLLVLAREKAVPTDTDPSLPYAAVALIKELDG